MPAAFGARSVIMRRNVLITSAGRRGGLVAAFQRELKQLLPAGKVFAADCRPEMSVACHLADGALEVPRIDDPEHASHLRELCERHEIGLVVPTIDTELALLAGVRDEFAADGTQIVVSQSEFIQVCRDKRRTAEWFCQRGLQTPRQVDVRGDVQFPIFVKPYDGSCGKEARLIASPADLTPSVLDNSRLIFVEYLSPAEHDEYTIDMYYSRHSELTCLVPRLRIETRAGEVSKGRTARISAMDELRKRMGTIEGARGCITLQVFVECATGAVSAIEINPRFGGGFPLSYEAGANFPRWLMEEYLLGKTIENFDDWESDLTMLRYDAHVVVRSAAA
jgi:carbamoyl-phosphate synthase large subunit